MALKKYTKCDCKKLLLYRIRRLVKGRFKYLCLYQIPVPCEGYGIKGQSQTPHGLDDVFVELDKHSGGVLGELNM